MLNGDEIVNEEKRNGVKKKEEKKKGVGIVVVAAVVALVATGIVFDFSVFFFNDPKSCHCSQVHSLWLCDCWDCLVCVLVEDEFGTVCACGVCGLDSGNLVIGGY